jgi:DNA-directed RNA polymerase specialized sigma subunit
LLRRLDVIDDNVSRALKELLGSLPRNGRTTQNRKDEGKRAQIAEMLGRGVSQSKIAEELGITKGRVSQIVKEIRGRSLG